MIDYKQESPYSNTPQTSWYLGNFVRKTLAPHSEDTLLTVSSKFHQRPDLLSYSLYGTTSYWWVFMARNINLIRDPIGDLKEGMVIYAPSIARLSAKV